MEEKTEQTEHLLPILVSVCGSTQEWDVKEKEYPKNALTNCSVAASRKAKQRRWHWLKCFCVIGRK